LDDELLAGEPVGGDRAALSALDARLDELEGEMRELAFRLPVNQLRSTLPERAGVDRRALLDLLLGAEIAGLEGTSERIPTFDYLITLLCAGGDPGAPLQDPVTLTPRLHGLCQQSDVDYDPRLPELEAEFYAASDMHEGELRQETQLRTLRHRKMDLGSSFFAPRALRAIMTYNAALRRRTADAPPAHDATDRIAWCLDLTSLRPAERTALLSPATGRRENLEGTTVLVGLLCRSAVVLEEEFPAIGISGERLAGAWIEELGDALQQEVNQHLVDHRYDDARILSELKSMLLAPKAGVRRERNPRPASAPAEPRDRLDREARKQAKEITQDALEALPSGPRSWRLRDLPWDWIALALGGALLVTAVVAWFGPALWDASRLDRAQLSQVSPFLTSGRRSAEGVGPAFVGTLERSWSALDDDEQSLAAEALVQALRVQGVREVMVYDAGGRLRIRALGGGSLRLVPEAREP
jgi:hypothetical protein